MGRPVQRVYINKDYTILDVKNPVQADLVGKWITVKMVHSQPKGHFASIGGDVFIDERFIQVGLVEAILERRVLPLCSCPRFSFRHKKGPKCPDLPQ